MSILEQAIGGTDPVTDEFIEDGKHLSEKYSDNREVLACMYLTLRDVMLRGQGKDAPVIINGKKFSSYREYIQYEKKIRKEGGTYGE